MLDTYHVIDRFDATPADPCLHGQLVYEVVKQTLAQAGAPERFLQRVRKVEIDYFAHRKAARSVIERYLHQSTTQRNELTILKWLDQLEASKIEKADRLNVPLLYIQALNYSL